MTSAKSTTIRPTPVPWVDVEVTQHDLTHRTPEWAIEKFGSAVVPAAGYAVASRPTGVKVLPVNWVFRELREATDPMQLMVEFGPLFAPGGLKPRDPRARVVRLVDLDQASAELCRLQVLVDVFVMAQRLTGDAADPDDAKRRKYLKTAWERVGLPAARSVADSLAIWEDQVNATLHAFPLQVRIGDGPVPPREVYLADAAVLQLVLYAVGGNLLHWCQSTTCHRPFVSKRTKRRPLGTPHKDPKYCSDRCEKAQTTRNDRARQKEASP